MEEKKQAALRVGLNIIVLLLVLTVIEFFIGAYLKLWWAAIILFIISFTKAFFVVRDYMHVRRVFSSVEETH